MGPRGAKDEPLRHRKQILELGQFCLGSLIKQIIIKLQHPSYLWTYSGTSIQSVCQIRRVSGTREGWRWAVVHSLISFLPVAFAWLVKQTEVLLSTWNSGNTW